MPPVIVFHRGLDDLLKFTEIVGRRVAGKLIQQELPESFAQVLFDFYRGNEASFQEEFELGETVEQV
jgi:hypothetical protein